MVDARQAERGGGLYERLLQRLALALEEADTASRLLLRPINVRGYTAPNTPPPGWPYGAQWVHLVSSGIDFYPQWLFNGPPVSTSRISITPHRPSAALITQGRKLGPTPA